MFWKSCILTGTNTADIFVKILRVVDVTVPAEVEVTYFYGISYLLHMSYSFDCTIFHRLVFCFQLEVKHAEILVSNFVPKSTNLLMQI